MEPNQRDWHGRGCPCASPHRGDRLTTSSPSELRKALIDSSLTVTHLLETLTGERLVAEVVRQNQETANRDNDLGVSDGHAVTHRSAILRGCVTDLPYHYAESMFVAERLPAQVRAQLEQTSDPIGRVLVAHKLRLDRQALPPPDPFGASAPSPVSGLASEIALSRAYRLMSDGLPVLTIREWFLRWVVEALDRQAHD